jgi:hypothetical protein
MISKTPPNPQTRKGTGVLKRQTLYDFMRMIAPHLGFQMAADDIIGSRTNGGGLYVRRKLHLPPAYITLELERQTKWGEAFYCTGIFKSGSYYTNRSQKVNYQFGSITFEGVQPSPGPHIFNPISYPTRHSCASVVNTDDRVPGKNYGNQTSAEDTEYSGALSADGLLDVAKVNVQNDGAVAVVQSHSWYQLTTPPSWSAVNLGYWTNLGSPYSTRRVWRYDYRWKITGAVDLRIQWTQGGTNWSLDLDGDSTSGWYYDVLPSAGEAPNRDKITAVTVTEL